MEHDLVMYTYSNLVQAYSDFNMVLVHIGVIVVNLDPCA